MATTSAGQLPQTLNAPMDPNAPVPDAYWQLIEQYRAELIHQALAIVNNLQDAEDVVQETFCEAVRNPQNLAQVRSLRAWLRTSNRANALNRLRDRRKSAENRDLRQRQFPPRAATTGGFSLVELREAVHRAVETLPPQMRRVVVLRYLEHLSYDEIASRTKLNAGTVGWILCEAAQKLHGKLKVFVNAPAQAENATPDQGA